MDKQETMKIEEICLSDHYRVRRSRTEGVYLITQRHEAHRLITVTRRGIDELR